MLYSDRMSGDGIDKRRTERMEMLSEPRGEVMVYQPMVLTDISRAGAQIETTFPLLIDSLHDFRFELGELSIVVKGRVVHAHVVSIEDQATIYRAGIEFVEPSERVVTSISAFMEAVVAARARG
jgi:hypothetical protein